MGSIKDRNGMDLTEAGQQLLVNGYNRLSPHSLGVSKGKILDKNVFKSLEGQGIEGCFGSLRY